MDTYFNQRFGTGASRAEMIDDWVQGLRRRADVTVLYVAPSAGTTVTRR
jgi:hypothetical protein